MKRKYQLFCGLVAALAVATALVSAASALTSTVVYNNIPSPQPGNLPSVSFEATGTSEFGGQVQLAGTSRTSPIVTVLMSSWGCETGNWTSSDCVTTPGATFSEPITLNLYAVGTGNAPGLLIVTTTQTFNIPYRPSASASCGDGRWSDGTTCFNGYATPVSFSLSGVTLPSNVIVSLAYNTTHYGYTPVGPSPCSATSAGCGYDSLNVAVTGPPTVGSDPVPTDAYQDTSYDSCSNGAIHPFGLDTGCWTGFQPAITIEASPAPVAPPTSKDQCKGDGWKVFNNPSFANQGACVSYVVNL